MACSTPSSVASRPADRSPENTPFRAAARAGCRGVGRDEGTVFLAPRGDRTKEHMGRRGIQAALYLCLWASPRRKFITTINAIMASAVAIWAPVSMSEILFRLFIFG